jgi:hypothetical protein
MRVEESNFPSTVAGDPLLYGECLPKIPHLFWLMDAVLKRPRSISLDLQAHSPLRLQSLINLRTSW